MRTAITKGTLRIPPTYFALAHAASVPQTREAALGALPKVARTGSHLLTFAEYVEQFRGWGRGLRRAVGSWYTARPVDRLAYQAVKYRQRGGWTHRDLLRLAHPRTDERAVRATFDWIAHGAVGEAVRRRALARGRERPAEGGRGLRGPGRWDIGATLPHQRIPCRQTFGRPASS